MPAYGSVLIDIDLGIGRQYGYRHPRTAAKPSLPATLSRCHPERPMHARWLCRPCYDAARKTARPH